ncbi:uncharacterized protein LOC134536065 [Bacillus rossius redtenbacheri]|uniref:uncharacterized protein LOC134536065 n=1 Tax=Bacillus rossius redtenbacheri TaxID=93214 RepID=UPI002FDD1EE7
MPLDERRITVGRKPDTFSTRPPTARKMVRPAAALLLLPLALASLLGRAAGEVSMLKQRNICFPPCLDDEVCASKMMSPPRCYLELSDMVCKLLCYGNECVHMGTPCKKPPCPSIGCLV